MKWSATAWQWFSYFFENAFVSRVNRRIPILMVRFAPAALAGRAIDGYTVQPDVGDSMGEL